MLYEYVNKIVYGNCLDVMRRLDGASIDLVLTSPPYDNLRKYNGYTLPLCDIIKEMYYVVKDGGIVVWVVNDATIDGCETGTSFKTALKFIDVGFNLHDTMIFEKANPIPQFYSKRYTSAFEYMFVFSKGKVKTHNPIMDDCIFAGKALNGITYKTVSTGKQVRGKPANPVKQKKMRTNIWKYAVGACKEDKDSRWHPAPFPYKLAEDHIVSWTNENDIVLDPMCGSGTVCLAAKNLGRRYIGVDISREYCMQAAKRLG